MRLWSVHPKYLDVRGLVALWREGLLAKKVIEGKTKGYKNHPQLRRFLTQQDPLSTINAYLWAVWEEGKARNYRFNEGKLQRPSFTPVIYITESELTSEWHHLLTKLVRRDVPRYELLKDVKLPDPHPIMKTRPEPAET